MCAKWRESFSNFVADMGLRPAGLTLERKDNDGNYEPDNCKWATRKEQRLNQRTCHYIVVDGERLTIRHAADRFGLDERTVHGRLGRGWSLERAIKTPADPRYKRPPCRPRP